jgi:hypothetical protein
MAYGQQSTYSASIHILDDDSLLNIFYLYRPAIFDGDEDDEFSYRRREGMGSRTMVVQTRTRLPKMAKPRYLDRHPTWVFASSVHMARQSQTCWHIHLPFLSSSITLTEIGTSLQKMKRE